MVKQGGLVAVMAFMLLAAPAWAPGPLPGAHEDPQATRLESQGLTQRGEDPLQAPRGETR
jgi:hypothetical protein